MNPMSDFTALEQELRSRPRRWLVTGVAGFIGSHLAETLLALGQDVTGLDNFFTGRWDNLSGFEKDGRFTFIEGDIRDDAVCAKACAGADYVLHHAAAASVPLSIEQPALIDAVNSGGFLNILLAAHGAGVRHAVYASSSAVYGDGGAERRHEGEPLHPLSPYAASKCANELYARVIAGTHGLSSTGLRYFNIYGPRQDPAGAYAAVIPRWIAQMRSGQAVEIYGDGETARDFCYVGDVVRANILAALAGEKAEESAVYNIAGGRRATLNDLFGLLKPLCGYGADPVYRDFRAADIRLSHAAVEAARDGIGFVPSVSLEDGLERTVRWYGAHGDG